VNLQKLVPLGPRLGLHGDYVGSAPYEQLAADEKPRR